MTNAALTATFPSAVRYVDRDLRPVAGGLKTFAGGLAAANPGGTKPGFFGPATGALGERVVGRFYGKYGQVDNSAGGDGAVSAEIEFFHERKLYLVNNDATLATALTAAQRETMVAVLNDNAATLDVTGLRADLGIFYDFSEDGSGQVWVEFVYPSSAQDEGPVIPGTGFVARAALLTIHAYAGTGTGTLTSTATGTFASQNSADGVTVAVGDILFAQPGLTNLAAIDSGPWQVASVGGAGKWSMQRPLWWNTGSKWVSGQTIAVGGEGQIYKGTRWAATAAAGVIDTTDPAFYCREITFAVTLGGTGTAFQTLSANQPSPFVDYPLTGGTAAASACPIGIMPVTASGALPTVLCSYPTTVAGTATLSVGYGILAAPTPGYVGTAAATVNAIKSGAVVNTNPDASTINVTIKNPC